MFQIAVPWVEYVDAIESSHYDRPAFIVRISLPWPLLVFVAADRESGKEVEETLIGCSLSLSKSRSRVRKDCIKMFGYKGEGM